MSALPAWFSKTRRGHQISWNCHERDSNPCSSLVEGLWPHCKKTRVIPLSSSSCVPTALSCYTPAVGPERQVSFNDNQPDHHPLSASCHQTQPSLCSLYAQRRHWLAHLTFHQSSFASRPAPVSMSLRSTTFDIRVHSSPLNIVCSSIGL